MANDDPKKVAELRARSGCRSHQNSGSKLIIESAIMAVPLTAKFSSHLLIFREAES
jgi:hypothetical protein